MSDKSIEFCGFMLNDKKIIVRIQHVKKIKKTTTSSKGAVVNRPCPSITGGSLKMTCMSEYVC